MSLEKEIRNKLVAEAADYKKLDQLVRQGMMSPAQLPMLHRGLDKLQSGKPLNPQEREAVNKVMQSMLFIVTGDSQVFNKARQHTQKTRYQTESYTEEEVRELCHSKDHDCAVIVNHPEWGLGKPIYESHAIPDDEGNVEWYDVQFKHGIEKEVPAADMEILQSEGHEKTMYASTKKGKAKNSKQQAAIAIAKKEKGLDEYGMMTASTKKRKKKKPNVYAMAAEESPAEDKMDSGYKAKFQAMLKKTGKSLKDMSDEEKKKFFNAVDASHSAKNEEVIYESEIAKAAAHMVALHVDRQTGESGDGPIKKAHAANVKKHGQKVADAIHKNGEHEANYNAGTIGHPDSHKIHSDFVKKHLGGNGSAAHKAYHAHHEKNYTSSMSESVNEEDIKEYITSKQVKMAKGIAFDKRHKGGDMTGAAKKMEKIKKGLSNHPGAKKALRQANEEEENGKDYDPDKDHTMDPKSHVKKEGDKYCVYNKDGKKVKQFDSKAEAEAYAVKNHDALMELKMHPQHSQIKKYAKAKASDTFKRTFGAVGDGGPEGDTSKARAAGKKVLRKLKKPLAKTGMAKAANKAAKKSSDRMIDLTRQDSGSSEPVKKFTNKQRKDQMKTGNYPDANDKEYRKNVEQVEESQDLEERNKQNAMKRKMMDASRGARYKLNNPNVPDSDHKTPQAQNKAIGRALRSFEDANSDSMEKQQVMNRKMKRKSDANARKERETDQGFKAAMKESLIDKVVEKLGEGAFKRMAIDKMEKERLARRDAKMAKMKKPQGNNRSYMTPKVDKYGRSNKMYFHPSEDAQSDARRDAKMDSRGLAPTKKDKPDMQHKGKKAGDEKDGGHIVMQLRKAVSINKPVKFKDGKSHNISKADAHKYLNKYMQAKKPADKEKMHSAHDSHDAFKKHL